MKKYILLIIFLLSIIPIFHTESQSNYVIASIFIPPQNMAEIYSLVYEVSNPSSPLYHHFLNSTEIQKLTYNPAYNYILNYLYSHNIKVLMTSLNIIVINISTYQLENLLNVSISIYHQGNLSYYQGQGYFHGSVIIASNLTSELLNKPTDLVTPSLLSKMEGEAIKLNFTYADETYPITWLLKAYNATNATGKGYTIGILDFYGDPTILQQLAYIDKLYNIPPPPSFKIEYIGEPCPFGGILSGWNLEISLDVEVAHVIAPQANIVLYVANPNVPLPAVLAKIVQEDKVNVLSQSWGIAESQIVDNPSNLMTIYETNLYYALGSLEGITFLASSGDTGGSGYSISPIGSVNFPSSSPFVTAVGGTTTYIDLNGSSYQTAWSNYGFIPYFINYGGSTGGVSVLFAKPWYQSYIPTPTTYPNGRMVPDISLNANVFPGIQVVFPGNLSCVIGGTSESSPLFAGLLTLIMEKDNTTFGLINPLLYYLGEYYYNKSYYPITFGYNIPWTAKYGYNLITGLGAPNIGEISYLIKTIKPKKFPMANVELFNSTNSTFYFLPYQDMRIIVNISNSTNNNYEALVCSLQGEDANIELHYNGSLWIGNYIIPPNLEGPINIIVKGKEIVGEANAFVGYILNIKGNINIVNALIKGKVYDIYGKPVNISSANITIYQYQPINNTFVKISNVILKNSKDNYEAIIGKMLNAGPALIVGNNVYAYISTFIGSSLLLNTLIIPPVVVEPGVVTPGESLFIEPTNLPIGNINISAELINNEGKIISVSNLSWVLIPYDGLLTYVYIGFLNIPSNVNRGLYTILLNEYSNLFNKTILSGRYYSQIYIVPNNLTVNVKINGMLTEGSDVKILANITYPNGSEVKYGMFSATVYPIQIQSRYETLTESLEIPLWFNGSLWIGNFTLPSTYTQGNLTYLTGNFFGPFGIFISGISANGYPTTNNLNSQRVFIVQPYDLIDNETITFGQTFYTLFENDIIKINGELFDDILVNDTIANSNLKITNSVINGTLIIKDAHVTLVDVNANKILVKNSTLEIIGSSVNNITLINSTISNQTSRIKYLYPSLPNIIFSNNEIIVNGSQIKDVIIYDNGKLIINGNEKVIKLHFTPGNNEIVVSVYQNDGEVITKTFYAYNFSTQNSVIPIVSIALSLIAIVLVVIMYRRVIRRT